jgi:hypothetical protein
MAPVSTKIQIKRCACTIFLFPDDPKRTEINRYRREKTGLPVRECARGGLFNSL